jgi:Cu/Ag efflux pump CusA
MAMPLSFSITLLVFKWADISVNSMTLGGLAVAIGMVVDDAIVDVENVFRRLRENAMLEQPHSRLKVIAKASGEGAKFNLLRDHPDRTGLPAPAWFEWCGGPVVCSHCRCHDHSMTASFVVSLTVIPVLCSVLLRPKAGGNHRDGIISRSLKWLLEHLLLRLHSQPTTAGGRCRGHVGGRCRFALSADE